MLYPGVRTLFRVPSQTRLRGSQVVLQHFKENPFFSDPVLKKVYGYSPPTDVDGEKRDEYGITDAQAAFSWDLNVEPQVIGRVSTGRHGSFTPSRFVGHENILEG